LAKKRKKKNNQSLRQGTSEPSALPDQPAPTLVTKDIKIIREVRLISYGLTAVACVCFIGFVYAFAVFGGSWVDDLDDQVGEVLVQRAKNLEATGRSDDALLLYEQSMSATFSEPSRRTVASNYFTGRLLEKDRYADVAAVTRTTLQKNGGDKTTFLHRFQALHKLDRNEEATEVAIAWHTWVHETGRNYTIPDLAPLACALYGISLMESGKEGEALEQLYSAVGVREHPAEKETGKPYYLALPRLTLGKYYLEQDNVAEAVKNFELARAYAAPTDTEYSSFHASLYKAYAQQGLWARALEFGEPTQRELDALDDQTIAWIARFYEGRQDWSAAGPLAKRLLIRGSYSAKAHYLTGRDEWSKKQHRASLFHLEQSELSTYPHSAFFLGTALEENGQPAQAIQSLLRTPLKDLYRPFALAKAATLLADLPQEKRTFTTATPKELLRKLDHEVAQMRGSQRPILQKSRLRLNLVTFKTSEAHSISGGRFPILILWEDKSVSGLDPNHLSLSTPDSYDSIMMRRGSTILQLRWVENLVNWESVDRPPPGESTVPGWIDMTHDWFSLRPDQAARVQQDDNGNSVLAINKLTWLYSVPVQAHEGDGYLLAGRVRGPKGQGSLGWQSIDEDSTVLHFDKNISKLSGTSGPDTWRWQAGYINPQSGREALRVQLTLAPWAQTVEFDDVMLIELNEPDPVSIEQLD
jgi:tetratricopeptide (TPR) repeat protein